MNRMHVTIALWLVVSLGLVVAQPQPQQGGVLRLAVSEDPPGLDPHRDSGISSTRILSNLFDGLVWMRVDGTFEGRVASDWEISEDASRYVFHIRENVYFHNGRQVTADDVKYSLDRARTSTEGGRAVDYAAIREVNVLDDFTVEILADVDVSLFAALAQPAGAIVPEEVADGLRTQPVGSGPFRLEGWQPGSSLRLVRFDDYWDPERPYLDEVVFRILPDETTALAALEIGDIDGLPNASSDAALVVESNPNIINVSGASYNVLQIYINHDRAPFDDVLVRRALHHAIDAEEVLQAAFWEGGVPGTNVLPPTSPFSIDLSELYPLDPERSRELLAEAGFPGGVTVEMIVSTHRPLFSDAATVIVEQAALAGFNIQVRVMEFAEYLARIWAPSASEDRYHYQLVLMTTGTRLDPAPYLDRYTANHPNNHAQYHSLPVTELLQSARQTGDFDERGEIYAEAVRLMAEDALAVPIGDFLRMNLLRANVGGWEVHPLDHLDVRDVFLGN